MSNCSTFPPGCCVPRIIGTAVGVADGAGLAELTIVPEIVNGYVHGILISSDDPAVFNVSFDNGSAILNYAVWHVPPMEPGYLYRALKIELSKPVIVRFTTGAAANVAAFLYSLEG